MIIAEIAKYLDLCDLGTFDEIGIKGDIFVLSQPPAPDSCITLYHRGGPESDINLGYDSPNVQVIVRGTQDPRIAYKRALDVYAAMHGYEGHFIDGGTYVVACIGTQSGPVPIGQDESNRWEFSINFRLEIQNPDIGGGYMISESRMIQAENKIASNEAGVSNLSTRMGVIEPKIALIEGAYHNVKAFGAVADGVADDTDKLQDALDAVTGTINTVYLPDGTYKITDSLLFGSNINIKLAPNARIIRGANIDNMLRNKNVNGSGGYLGDSNIKIEGGIFDANKDSIATYCTIVGIGHAKNITIQGVTFQNCYDWHMIELNGVQNGKILECVFKDYGSATTGTEMVQLDMMRSTAEFPWFGPYDNTVCNDILIQGCRFENGVSAIGTHTSVEGFSHKNIRILGNSFENMRDRVIKMLNYESVIISNNYFNDCQFGIQGLLSATAVMKNINITNNHMTNINKDANGRAIHLAGTATAQYINGVIAGNTVDTVGRHGVGIDYCVDFSIVDNYVTNCAQAGVWLYMCKEVLVQGNRLKGNDTQNTGFRYDLTIGLTGQAGTNNISVIGNFLGTCGCNLVDKLNLIGNILTSNFADMGSLTNVEKYSNWINTAFDVSVNGFMDKFAGTVFAGVNPGTTTLPIFFSPSRKDTNYVINAIPNWDTRVWFSGKTKDGITLNFSDAPSGVGIVDWSLKDL